MTTIRIQIIAPLLALLLGCRGDAGESGHAHEDEGEGEHGAEDKHDDHEGEIVLDEHVIERNGISTEPAKRRLLLGSLEVPAEVQVNPDRTAHVASLVPGRLVEVRAALGDQVVQGDVLAVVDSVELGRARADLVSAQARKKAADAEVKRMGTLADEGIAAKKSGIEARSRADQARADVAAARATMSVYALKGGSGPELELRSPLSGTVIERHASPGEVVDRETPNFVVADLTQLWVMGRVYEQDLRRVREGVAAEVGLIAYPGRAWPGVVDYISSTMDEDTRSVAIRVVLENPDGLLRPGMFGTIALADAETGATRNGGKALSVPESAMSSVGDRTIVFVVGDEPGSFVPRDVVPGARAHGFIEIREGLKEGEETVVHGAFVLKSEFLKGSIGEGHAH